MNGKTGWRLSTSGSASRHIATSRPFLLSSTVELGLELPGLMLEATSNQFEATLGSYRIDQQLHVMRI